MEQVITILALGQLANVFVHFYINLMRNTNKWITAKPFSCQECMGVWIGLIYASAMKENILIFAGLTSLSAVIISAVVTKLNS